MMVDDDLDILQILEHVFQKQGFQTIPIKTGEACLDWLRKNISTPPNLIILDCHLPGMNGLQVLEEIKKEMLHSPPVLMLTALSQEKTMLKAYGLGVSEYMTKPFMVSILMQKALRLISS